MKFKLKSRSKIVINLVVVIFLLISLSLAISSSFYMQKLSTKTEVNSTSVIKTDKNITRSPKIDQYISSIAANDLVEYVDIKKEVTSVLTTENDKYQSRIFNYETGEDVTIADLIKEEYREEFANKIKELIYLKYPNFIADVISLGNQDDVYYLKDNELIIYFYNYEIDPAPKEDLFLVVNYNEIKDYLNITVDLDSEYQNEDGSVINTSKKLIAITFDDGPGPYTNRLVEILNANKAKATFFMLGNNLERYKDTVLNVYNNGHEIGWHSYAHKNFKRQEIATIQAEFAASNEILKSITGESFSLIRPPYGSIDTDIKNALDASFILWNVDTEDWRHKDTEYLLNYTLEQVSEGYIILFHDIHENSVDAMEKILPYLYVEGYQIVTVSQLAECFNTPLELHQSYRYFTR